MPWCCGGLAAAIALAVLLPAAALAQMTLTTAQGTEASTATGASAGHADPAEPHRPATVLDLRLGDHGDRTRFVLEVSRQLDYHLFAADDGAPRLVLDLPRVGFERFLGDREGLGLIRSLRGGPRRDGGGRMVLDMAGPVTVETVFYIPPRDGFGHRLVVDIVPAPADEFALLARHTLGNPAISLGGVDRTGADIPLASLPVQVPDPRTADGATRSPTAAQDGSPDTRPPALTGALPLAAAPLAGTADPDLALPTVRPPGDNPADRAGAGNGPNTPADSEPGAVTAARGGVGPSPPMGIPPATTPLPPPPLRPAGAPVSPPIPAAPPTEATDPAAGPAADGDPARLVTAALGPLPLPPRRPPVDWPVVVIDPGHGGVDPGAVSVTGVLEKTITLAVSRRLAERLRATGRLRVYLTRGDDRFLALRERVALARGWGGDLFVSIHADSIDNRDIRGASVYTLSDVASDAEAAALARRENRVDAIAGVAIDPEDDVMASILIDLAQQSTFRESHRFAGEVIAALDGAVPLLPNTHRQAGFAVLKAPDVPSVLVELGYLSSASDAQMLTDTDHQDRLADRLAAAVIAHFDALGRLDPPGTQAASLIAE